MIQMRKVASRHPIVWSVLVTLLFFASNFIGSLLLVFAPRFFYTNGDFLPQLVAESAMSLFGIALVFIFGYGYIWNQTKNFWSGVFCGGYMVFYPLISAMLMLTFIVGDPASMGYSYPLQFEPLWRFGVFTLTMFLIGLAEESFFRGVVANLFYDKHAKDPAGVWTAVIYAGIVFALMHSLNIIAVDSDGIGGVLVQMTGIIPMGMTLAAIYYRCRNIWALIFIHGFLDFCGLLTTGLFGGSISAEIGSYSPMTAIVTTVPYLIVVLVILRKKKVGEIIINRRVEIASANNTEAMGVMLSPEERVVPVSSPESKRSLIRAIIIAIVLWIVLFTGSVVMNRDIRNIVRDVIGSYTDEFSGVIKVEHSGEWNGERAFGARYEFEVEENGMYRVSIRSNPSSSNAYVLVQIKEGDEVCFEDNYGGICNVSFSLQLDKGEYELNLVYDYSQVENKEAMYDTEIRIR